MGPSLASRILVAFLILLVDGVVIFIPLGALFLAYVILARPRWFKDWVDQIYG